MMQNIIAKFSQPLAPYSINLSIENNLPISILGFGISSYTSKIPATWTTFGEFVGSVNVLSLYGIGTKEVNIRFANFIQGEVAQFNGIAFDVHACAIPLVKNLAIEGAHSWVQLSDGDTRFARFEIEDGDVCAMF